MHLGLTAVIGKRAGVLSVVVAQSMTAGAVVHVDDDARPGGDGASWRTAYRFLQDALADPAGDEIRIAQGTYRPDRSENAPNGSGSRAASFRPGDGTSISGGFLGLSAGKGQDPDERSVERYRTVLSGDLMGDDGPGFQNVSDNSYHVAMVDSVTATIDGVIITAGYAESHEHNQVGGAVLVSAGGLNMRDCTITANLAERSGGGIGCISSDASLIGCRLDGNRAILTGGAIYVSSSGDKSAVIRDCTFNHNHAELHGGAMRVRFMDTEIQSCLFTENAADDRGGAISIYDGTAVIALCRFSGNSAGNVGSGVAMNVTVATVNDCAFVANEAAFGGALYARDSESIVVQGSTFTGNTSSSRAGGVVVGSSASAEIVNCILWGNTPSDLTTWSDATLQVWNTCVRGGWSGLGANNIGLDPQFVAGADGDIRLDSGSPCIDAGKNDAVPPNLTVDLAGNPRFKDEPCVTDGGSGGPPVVDLGALEHVVAFMDCNDNAIRDPCDISGGVSLDNNENGVPDECEPGQYTGPSGGAWFDPANWGSGAVPDATTAVTIPTDVVIAGGGAVASTVIVTSGGSLTLAGGEIEASLVDVFPGGVVRGEGTISGDVFNRGTLRPGAPIGLLTVAGEYRQTFEGSLEIEIDGLVPGHQHDVLEIAGAAWLDGTLAFAFPGVFRLVCFDCFDVLHYGDLVEEGMAIAAPSLHTGLRLAVDLLADVARVEMLPFRRERQKLVEPVDTASSGPSFGDAVAIHGDVAVVGAPLAGVNDTNGWVRVYRNVGGVWTMEHLLASPYYQARFGRAVALSDDRIVVGIPQGLTGRAAVYEFVGASWQLDTELALPDPGGYEQFGGAVALHEDVVIVGARHESAMGHLAGAAFVYRPLGNEWIETRLVASDAHPDALFGSAVGIHGDTAVVGAMWDDNANGYRAGAIYVYRYDGASWAETKLLAPGGQAGGWFGQAVAIEGEVIVVGNRGSDLMADGAGVVHVFSFDGNEWQPTQLTAPDPRPHAAFGWSVDIDGNTIVVGSSRTNSNFDPVGAAYVFRWDGAEWILGEKLIGTDVTVDHDFGRAVAIGNGRIMVGAATLDRGSVYAYDGVFRDCNGNGILDNCDIAAGESEDQDADGVPDECEGALCPGDLDNTGDVGSGDLVAVLEAWGDCGGCGEDLDRDGMVGFSDVLRVLVAWGECW